MLRFCSVCYSMTAKSPILYSAKHGGELREHPDGKNSKISGNGFAAAELAGAAGLHRFLWSLHCFFLLSFPRLPSCSITKSNSLMNAGSSRST